jgi:DNA primase
VISQQTIQQIIARTDVIDIIGSFVKLKKRGTNYIGLCPFHNEKSPSFTVSPAKEIYKCFGCGRSGNSVGFIMEHEKYSYVEALKWLAARYNIEIEETFVTDDQKELRLTADSLFIINNFAQQFFTKQLFETEEGRDIGLSYLKERGFREDTITKFQLGYSPEQRDAFTKAALANQYNPELLLKTGLVNNRNEQLNDNYRGRVIFPIHNHSGKVLGFGARILKSNDKAPKYINTPENEIYVKSKTLYGSYFARQAIDKADECLMVEGYTDVVSLHQAGIENVVASGGTSLTTDQLRLVKKYTNNLTIIYDGDAAGIKAALRGLDMALEEGLNVQLVLIPDKEDPDSYVNKVGAAAFKDFVKKNKKDFILFQLEVALSDAENDTTKKAAVVNQVAETISKINKAEDFTKQQDYIKQCAEILKIDEGGMHALVNKFIRDKISTLEKKLPFEEAAALVPDPERTDFSNEAFSLLHQDSLQEQALAGVLLEHGLKPWDETRTVAEYIFEENMDDDLFENKSVFKLIVDYKDRFYAGQKPTIKDYTNSADDEVVKAVIAITNFPYDLSLKWTAEFNAGGIKKNIWELSYESFMGHLIKQGEINPEIYNKTEQEDYRTIVEDIMAYLQLRKIRAMILLNQKDMQLKHNEMEMTNLIRVHNFLKEKQMQLGKKKTIVSYPF